MFERFTDRARRVLVLAQDEAKAMEHDFLGTEHLLLGMVKEGEGVAAKALTELGVDHEGLRAKVLALIPVGEPGAASGAPPFTPRSKHVLELSLREALDMNHNYIGTEHLLLGLIRDGEGVAAQVLVAAGLSPSAVRAKVVSMLAGFAATSSPFGRTTPAATLLGTRAKAIAATDAVGSHHFLLGILEDPTSLGARVLTSLGVTREAVAARVRDIGVAGTTDELPTVRATAPKPFRFDFGNGVTLEVADAEQAKQIALVLSGATGEEATAAAVASIVADALSVQDVPPPEEPGEDAAKPDPA
ncbi:MAG TPA: Clp protease N-terminal domain-containing protein [Acidimicrobiales bacterium]|nr:Clp protease N-terminal domain-containing protein [Acidimicrobiales bacterium]